MFPAIAPKTYSTLVADDVTLVRKAKVASCQARAWYRMVVNCSEGTTALRLIQSEKPDIAALDLNLRHPFTLEIVRKLWEAQPQTGIVEEVNLKGKASLATPAGDREPAITLV
jgi:DNA-binding NarL/FixJ family response regulator